MWSFSKPWHVAVELEQFHEKWINLNGVTDYHSNKLEGFQMCFILGDKSTHRKSICHCLNCFLGRVNCRVCPWRWSSKFPQDTRTLCQKLSRLKYLCKAAFIRNSQFTLCKLLYLVLMYVRRKWGNRLSKISALDNILTYVCMHKTCLKQSFKMRKTRLNDAYVAEFHQMVDEVSFLFNKWLFFFYIRERNALMYMQDRSSVRLSVW